MAPGGYIKIIHHEKISIIKSLLSDMCFTTKKSTKMYQTCRDVPFTPYEGW